MLGCNDVVDEIFRVAAVLYTMLCPGGLHETVTRHRFRLLTVLIHERLAGDDDEEFPAMAVCVDGTGLLTRCESRQFQIERMVAFRIPECDRDVLSLAVVITGLPRPLLVLLFDVVDVYDPVSHVRVQGSGKTGMQYSLRRGG